MKKLQEKLLSLLVVFKGKRPAIIVLSLVVIGLYLLGVHYGFLSDTVVDFGVIVETIDGLFKSAPVDTLSNQIDTLSNTVDTTSVIVDTLVK
jgi:hypothetical protein